MMKSIIFMFFSILLLTSFAFAQNTNEPSALIIAKPITGIAPLPVQFEAQYINFKTDELEFSWEFGDGGLGTGSKPSYIYKISGNFIAKLRISELGVKNANSILADISIQVKESSETSNTISISSPSANKEVSGIIPIIAESENIARAILYVNEEKISESTEPFVFTWDTRKDIENYEAKIKIVSKDNEQVFDTITVNVDNSVYAELEKSKLEIIGKPIATVNGSGVTVTWQTNKDSSSTLIYWKAGSEKKDSKKSSVNNPVRLHKLSSIDLDIGGYFYIVESEIGKEKIVSEEGFFEIISEYEKYPAGFKPIYCSLYCGISVSEEERTNLEPVINSLTVLFEGSGSNEGEPFTFVADAFDPNNDDLYYLWDYGDGTTDFGKELFNVKHSFILPEDKKEKSFVVKLYVEDRISGRDTKTEIIDITKSKYRLKLVNPKSTLSERLKKGPNYPINVQVLDSNNNIVRKDLVTKITGKFAEEELIFEKDKTSDLFNSVLKTKLENHSPISYVKVEAIVSVLEGKEELTAEFPIYLKPSTYSLGEFPIEEYFLGKTLGDIQFRLESESGDNPKDADLKAVLISGGVENPYLVSQKNQYFVTTIPVKISEVDIENGMILKIVGSDRFGNNVRENTFLTIPIQKENPLFNIELLQPVKSGEVGFGEILKLKSSILSEIDFKPELTTISALSSTGEKDILTYNSKTKEYEGTLKAPNFESGLDQFSIRLSSNIQAENESLRDFEDYDFTLTNDLKVKFIQPTAIISFVPPKDRNTVFVSITYPDGQIFDNNTIRGIFSIDGNEQSILFEKNSENLFFQAGVVPLIDGEHFMNIELQGTYRGRDSMKTYVFFLDFPLIAGAFVIIIILWILKNIIKENFLSKQAKRAKEAAKIEEGITKRQNLIGLLKRLKVEYYKRHITEKEYKQRLIATQKELKALEDKLGLDKQNRLRTLDDD